MKVTKYGLKRKFSETKPDEIGLFESIKFIFEFSECRYYIELYDIYLYEIDDVTDQALCCVRSVQFLIDNNYSYTETKIPEEETAKLVSSNMGYTYFYNVTTIEELMNAIRLEFINSLKLLKFSETFSIILYEKIMNTMLDNMIAYWYRCKLMHKLKYIKAICSENLSKDMQVYLILKEIENK
jgi:hypothetical protein